MSTLCVLLMKYIMLSHDRVCLFTAEKCTTIHEVSNVWSGRGGRGIGMMGGEEVMEGRINRNKCLNRSCDIEPFTTSRTVGGGGGAGAVGRCWRRLRRSAHLRVLLRPSVRTTSSLPPVQRRHARHGRRHATVAVHRVLPSRHGQRRRIRTVPRHRHCSTHQRAVRSRRHRSSVRRPGHVYRRRTGCRSLRRSFVPGESRNVRFTLHC